MKKWIIYNKDTNLSFNENIYEKFRVGNFFFVIEKGHKQSFVKKKNSEGLFIFGNIIPRLDHFVDNCIYEDLLNGLKRSGPEYINYYKGNFLVISFFGNKILIFNDQFGVNKYFYLTDEKSFIASNHISLIKKNHELQISRKSILLYYVFNYFIEGRTLYDKCHYSEGGSFHLLGSRIKKGNYFTIDEFLKYRAIKYNKKDSIYEAANIWENLFNQYLNIYSNKKISQTLTAGMDSRLILAGFRVNDFRPDSFTFGLADSMDVIHAKKIAEILNLNHLHYFPNREFFDNFSDYASDVIEVSSGMASLYRAHRYFAYNSLAKIYDVIFYGFVGSEIIRGLYPDGILLPNIISDLWTKGFFNLRYYYPNNILEYSDNELKEIKVEILDYDFIKRPDFLIFKLIIPLHFSQDISIANSLELISLTPYWDLDFLEFQKNTPFFIDNKRKKDFTKLGHFRRRNGPYFSANLISLMDRQNSKLSLGKGYSPYDYTISKNYASLKFFINKYIKKYKYSPNFDYKNWFKVYLIDYLNNSELFFSNINKNKLINNIKNIKGNEEISYLDYVKALNINLIHNQL